MNEDVAFCEISVADKIIDKKSLFLASEHFAFVGFLVGAKGAVNNPAPQNYNIDSC
jgi:hypothetical protein